MSRQRRRHAFRWSIPLACVAAAPASSAGPWFDRAERDIAALPVTPPQGMPLLAPHLLASELYGAAPTASRRALVARAIVAAAEAEHRSAGAIRTGHQAAACILAEVGDLAGARQQLALSSAPTTRAVPATDPSMELALSLDPGALEVGGVEASLLLGDPAPLRAAQLSAFDYLLMVQTLMASGHPAQAHQVVDRAKGAVAERARQPRREFEINPVNDPSWLVNISCACEDWTGAMADAAAAARVATTQPSTSGPSGATLAFRAYLSIAREAIRADRPDVARDARAASVALLSAHPDDPYMDPTQAAELCAAARDRKGFDAALAAARAWFAEQQRRAESPNAIGDVRSQMDLARWCIDMGERANFDGLVAEADRALAAVTRKDRARDVATGYMELAAACARADDLAGVKRALAASERADPNLEAGRRDDGWSDIAYAYADAGSFASAVAAAGHIQSDEGEGQAMLAYVALREASAGRFADAWRQLMALPASLRSRYEYAIAVRQAQAGKVDGPIAAPTAHERALLEMAVGTALLGRPYAGGLQVYRPPGE